MSGTEPAWQVEITQTAADLIHQIRDKRIQKKILDAISELEHAPEQKGKPLVHALAGYRSLRVVGQRYHIVYRVEAERVVVYVVAVGIRKEGDRHDIYALAQRLLNAGLLKPPS